MSRWGPVEDDKPLTYEELQEMKVAFNREVRRLRSTGYDWRKGPVITKKATRRELRYLEALEAERRGELVPRRQDRREGFLDFFSG